MTAGSWVANLQRSINLSLPYSLTNLGSTLPISGNVPVSFNNSVGSLWTPSGVAAPRGYTNYVYLGQAPSRWLYCTYDSVSPVNQSINLTLLVFNPRL